MARDRARRNALWSISIAPRVRPSLPVLSSLSGTLSDRAPPKRKGVYGLLKEHSEPRHGADGCSPGLYKVRSAGPDHPATAQRLWASAELGRPLRGAASRKGQNRASGHHFLVFSDRVLDEYGLD